MQIKCPECNIALEIEDSKAGQNVVCRFCGHKFIAGFSETGGSNEEMPNITVENQAPVSNIGTSTPASPPNLPGYGESDAIDKPFVSPKPRATVAMLLCALAILASGAAIWLGFDQLDFLQKVQEMNKFAENNPHATNAEITEMGQAQGVLVTEDEFVELDSRERTISICLGVTVIIFFITYLVWVYRAYKNLYSLRATQIRSSPGGSLGWYFCPIANLWKPFQVMNDIWLGSRYDLPGSACGTASAFITLWWLVWLADTIVSQISFHLSPDDCSSLKTIAMFVKIHMFSNVVGIVSLVLTMILISWVTSRQIDKHNHLQIGSTMTEYGQV